MANFIVTTLEDETVSGAETVASPDGAGLSLREALALTLANGSNTADTITFAPGLAGGTISLTAFQQLTVAGNVTIDGDLNDDGQADITIARPSVGLPPLHAGQFRVLEVDAGSVTLEGLKITNGNAGDHAFGHGILATAGAHLTILQSEIFGNGNHDIASAGGGLGITAGAEVTIIANNIHHNNSKANGAGISNFGGTLNIFDSTISANQTDANGPDLYAGGIFSEGNTTVTNSTIANNVGGDGAGISHLSGTLRLTNVTLWANDSPNHRAEGAGLYVGAGSEAILTNVTVTGNRAGATGGGIAAYGHVTLTNSIVTGNMQGLANGGDMLPNDTSGNGTLTLTGANIVSDKLSVGGVVIQSGLGLADIFADVITIQPINSIPYQTGALADYGGPVRTVAIKVGGAAHDPAGSVVPLDATDADRDGNVTEALPIDARGLMRGSGAVDLGAFEIQNPTAVPDFAGVQLGSKLTVGGRGVLANDTDPEGDPLAVSSVAGNAPGTAIHGAFGTLVLTANGGYAYTPDAKAKLPSSGVGQDLFAYTVNDGHGGQATSTLAITVYSQGQTYVAGTSGNDPALMDGGKGNGKSVLEGGLGDDTLLGGNGADVLIGGPGNNKLTGGNGPDTFLFNARSTGHDTITDFKLQNDHLQLAGVDVSSVDRPYGGAGMVLHLSNGGEVNLPGVHVSDWHLLI